MRHPVEELGTLRVCLETGTPFVRCWTTRTKRPRSAFNVCDQCDAEHETISQTLHRLNAEAKKRKDWI